MMGLEPPSPTVQVRGIILSESDPLVEVEGERVALESLGEGRHAGEGRYRLELTVRAQGLWAFTVQSAEGSVAYRTALHHFTLQDGQLYPYEPAPQVSPSRVLKLTDVPGRLGTRPLYVYLPRGYDEHPQAYPLLFMHDGQNVFTAFEGDSFAGSWRADTVADEEIAQGRMRECIIVGVSNGAEERLTEYLPPYSRFRVPARHLPRRYRRYHLPPPTTICGRADETLSYYRDDILPYLRTHYRLLEGREQLATCGASMGGLFSHYIAWEHADFALNHAILSPSYWVTRDSLGRVEAHERLHTRPSLPLRLYLDSGTQDAPGRGDDGMVETLAARDLLLKVGFEAGVNLMYVLAEGATHSEAAWSARLPQIFQFLFPSEEPHA